MKTHQDDLTYSKKKNQITNKFFFSLTKEAVVFRRELGLSTLNRKQNSREDAARLQ